MEETFADVTDDFRRLLLSMECPEVEETFVEVTDDFRCLLLIMVRPEVKERNALQKQPGSG